MAGKHPHVVVVPFPAQGHVMPLMKLSQLLACQGFKVTLVNMEFIHSRIMDSLPINTNCTIIDELLGDRIRLVSIPDGLTPDQQRGGAALFDAVNKTIPAQLERLIRNISVCESSGVACVIADVSVGCALEVAEKMGIRRAGFSPCAVAIKALALSIPTLIRTGIIDDNGTPKKNDEKVLLSPNMPAINTSHLLWQCMGDSRMQQMVFQSMATNDQIATHVDWTICNSSYELEPGAFSLVPNLLPIGPLIANNRLGNLWPEDPTCLTWLDQQAINSVIYVSFGSTSVFDQAQFNELALGLELLARPFLWVVRSNFTTPINALNSSVNIIYPDGFRERVAQHGNIVSWAPQEKLLNHPSIACFMSHCGWNSTMEGVSMGVPFICWPYFADQFLNQSYITDFWNVGLGLNPDENGLVTRFEIKRKVEQLIGDEGLRARAQKLKETVLESTSKGGSSSRNFEQFLKEIRSTEA